jgi:hypothetical protein
MKKASVTIIYLACLQFCLAQSNATDGINQKQDTIQNIGSSKVTPFITLGIISLHYQNSDLFEFMAQESNSAYAVYQYNSKTSLPTIGMGLELKSDVPSISYFIALNYWNITGQYLANFSTSQAQKFGTTTQIDSTNNRFSQNVLSVAYAIQIGDKRFFLNVGGNVDANFVNASQHLNSELLTTAHTSTSFKSDSTKTFAFATLALKLSIGAHFKFKRIGFNLRFYYDDYIIKGYDIFGAAVDVLLLPKKKSE